MGADRKQKTSYALGASVQSGIAREGFTGAEENISTTKGSVHFLLPYVQRFIYALKIMCVLLSYFLCILLHCTMIQKYMWVIHKYLYGFF